LFLSDGDVGTAVSLILQTYTLEEILEHNDVTEEEALSFMVSEGLLSLPNPKPVDV